MVAVITGDIINSRQGHINDWLPTLKKVLNQYGKEPKQWEIYRGDSFQLVTSPKQALLTAIHIKAAIKLTKHYDVRISIGIGEETHRAGKITESNGPAFVLSGEGFESLKKHTLVLKTQSDQINEIVNVMIRLASLTINSWSTTVARTVKITLENPHKNQKEIAGIIKKSQSSVSEALKRGGFDEIMSMNDYYQKVIEAE